MHFIVAYKFNEPKYFISHNILMEETLQGTVNTEIANLRILSFSFSSRYRTKISLLESHLCHSNVCEMKERIESSIQLDWCQ